MKIVDEDRERLRAAARCSSDASDSNTRNRRPQRLRLRPGGHRAELRQDRCQLGRVGAESRIGCRPVALAQPGPERLGPGPIRGGAARLPAAADQHSAARGPARDPRAPRPAGSCRSPAPRRSAPLRRFRPGPLRRRAELRQLPFSSDEPFGRADGRRPLRSLERRVLLEDRLLELLERAGPGSIPSSSTRTRARVAVRVERLRLPARAVEGEHELAA